MGMESLIQSSEVIVPRLKGQDGRREERRCPGDQQCTLFGFTTNPLIMSGLPNAYDDGTGGTEIYANIDRSQAANAFWKGQYTSNFNAAPTRANMLASIVQTATTGGAGSSGGAAGEAPDLIIMSPPDWTTR